MFVPGGQFAGMMGAGKTAGASFLSGGRVGGMFGRGFTNTAQGPISWL